MLKSRRRQEKTIVGLEMDPSHLAAAQVEVNGKLSVTKGAVHELRPGIVRDGEVVRPGRADRRAAQAVRRRRASTAVRIGIANQRIVVRTLDVPPVDDPETLEELVRTEAPDLIPVPMDEAVLDFQSLGRIETPVGPRTRVVIVAVRRDMIDRMVASAHEAGLDVVGIDLSAFGMVRALHASGSEHAVLYINLGGLTNVAVANDTGCLFTRAASGGLESMLQTLTERRGLTLEHARGWMQHVGLVAPLDAIEGDADLVAARPPDARGRRPHDRRHRAQLAQLLPHAGDRRDRRPRGPHRSRRRDPRLRRSGCPSSSRSPSRGPSWPASPMTPTSAA